MVIFEKRAKSILKALPITKERVLNEYSKSDKDLRLLAYEILVDKFNSKYKNLNESQRNLLKNYINNVSNTNSLRDFVDVEVVTMKKELNTNVKFVIKNCLQSNISKYTLLTSMKGRKLRDTNVKYVKKK